MVELSRVQKTELRNCKQTPITSCQVQDLSKYVNNPSGTDKADVANPFYKGKVIVKNAVLHINLSYTLTGNVTRAEIALKDLRAFFKKTDVVLNFTQATGNPDLRIHGATLTELVQGVKVCSCEDGLMLGGWAPSPQHQTWGNALLLSATTPRRAWKLETVHEFGHKLGLKHRRDGGIMDYAHPDKPDRRKWLPSDRARIMALYK